MSVTPHRVSGRNRLVRDGTIRSCRAIYCYQASSTLTYSSWPARRQQSNSDSPSSCRSCACQRQFFPGSVPFYTLLWLLVTLLVSSLMLCQPRLLPQWPRSTLLPNLAMTLFRTLWISPSAFYSPQSLALWSSHGGSSNIVDVEGQYDMSLHHLVREQIRGSHSRHYCARGIGTVSEADITTAS